MKSDRLAYPFEYILIMEKAWTEFLVISSTMWKEEGRIWCWYWYLSPYLWEREGRKSSS
jgi:hypothetical protein